MTENINGFILNLDFYSGQDQYCDGEIEQDLLEICKEQKADQALESRNEWPVLYHLS